MKSRSCQAGRMSVNVSNIGDVRPCPHNPIVYGNLFRESMETVWSKMSAYRDGGTTPLACKHCPTVLSCKGACRINALSATGQLDGLDRLAVGHVDLSKKSSNEIDLRAILPSALRASSAGAKKPMATTQFLLQRAITVTL